MGVRGAGVGGKCIRVNEDSTINLSSLQIGINILVKSKAFQYFMCKCEIPQLQAPSCLSLFLSQKVERQETSPAAMMLTC